MRIPGHSDQIGTFGGQRVFWVGGDDIASANEACDAGHVRVIGFSKAKGFGGGVLPRASELSPSVVGVVCVDLDGVDVSPVSDYIGIRSLDLHSGSGRVDLSTLTSLTELGLSWRRGVLLPGAESGLQRLRISGFKSEDKSLASLPAYEDLRYLELVRGNLVSLDGIERYRRLEHLSLAYVSSLSCLGAMDQLPLQILEMENCRKAVSVESISRCASLRKLRLSGCGSIKSAKFVDALGSLEFFSFVGTDVIDGDLSPLLRLGYVGFIDRRHYSHKYSFFQRRGTGVADSFAS